MGTHGRGRLSDDPVRDLLQILQRAYEDNNRPSLRQIALRMSKTLGREPARSHLSEVLRGKKFPSLTMTQSLVIALHASPDVQQRACDLVEQVEANRAAPVRRNARPRARGRPHWWPRSSYVDQVAEIVPTNGLVNRETELTELARFCSGTDQYVWWQAPPWAGKSALMATFVRNPPEDVDVVSFFVTSRLAGHADSIGLVDVLSEQLAAILGRPMPSTGVLTLRDTYRRSMIRDALQQVAELGRQLVLVVDGLDEDGKSRPGTGLASIASILPSLLGDQVRVIVSSRPDPPLPHDVADGHPLRQCRIRHLDVSPHATNVASRARRELNGLLQRGKAEQDIIGFLAARRGGLSAVELQQLTGLPPFKLEHILAGDFGRTVVPRTDHGAASSHRVYVFTHDALLEESVSQLGPALIDRYRARIARWAQVYIDRGRLENL
ncbi:hypothetical protein AB0K00_36665 [Dactylosporangium sp. NPDC049525]|uniref:hypothetical protein n=1 Tax=Dactylosporangium sp. NPDC049525 TaxID=3154730 RepID=UPI0034496331